MECIGEKSKDKICGYKEPEKNHEMVKKEISKEST
jgi:hypothetical protein